MEPIGAPARGRRETVFVVALLLLGLIASVLAFPSSIIVDDAYITFRYAANLAAGSGFVYNPGEHYLGTTTPLYALLLAVGAALFEEGIMGAAVVIHLLSVLGLTLLVYLLLEGKPFRVVALAFPILLVRNWYVSATAGMEALLFSAGCLLAIYCWFRRRQLSLGVVAALLCLIRPDGGVLGALLLAATWFENRKFPWRLLMAGVVAGLPWLLFSLFYFGSPFPSTVGAKIDQAQSYLWPSTHSYRSDLFEFFIANQYFWQSILAGVGALVAVVRRDRIGIVMVAWTLVHNGLYCVTGVPNYPWYYVAFVVQSLFFCLYLASFVPVERLLRVRPSLEGRLVPALATLVAVALLSRGVLRGECNVSKLEDLSPSSNRYYHIGRWLDEHAPREARVASVEIGIIGFYSRRYMVDLCGLVTPGISKYLKTGRHVTFALERYVPDYIVVREPLTGHEGGVENQLKWNYRRAYVRGDTAVYERIRWTEQDLARLFLQRCASESPGAVWMAGFPSELSEDRFSAMVGDGCQKHPLSREPGPDVRFVAHLTSMGTIDFAELVPVERTRLLPEDLYPALLPHCQGELHPRGLEITTPEESSEILVAEVGLDRPVRRIFLRLAVLDDPEGGGLPGALEWTTRGEREFSGERRIPFEVPGGEGARRILLEEDLPGLDRLRLHLFHGPARVLLQGIFVEESIPEGSDSVGSWSTRLRSCLEGRSPGSVFLPGFRSPDARDPGDVNAASPFSFTTEWAPDVRYMAWNPESTGIRVAALAYRGKVHIGAAALSRWTFLAIDEVDLQPGGLRLVSTSLDPFFFGTPRLGGPWRRVRLRFTMDRSPEQEPVVGAIYWTSSREDTFGEARKGTFLFSGRQGAQEVVYEFPGDRVDGVWQFRLDPVDRPGELILHEIVFERY